MPDAAYYRRRRASKGARTGQPGRRPTAECPSAACWKRHQRNGIPHDIPACHQAYLADQRRLYLQRQQDDLA